jgi:hypothetical protein
VVAMAVAVVAVVAAVAAVAVVVVMVVCLALDINTEYHSYLERYSGIMYRL